MKHYRVISLTVRLWNWGIPYDWGNGEMGAIDLKTAFNTAKIIWL